MGDIFHEYGKSLTIQGDTVIDGIMWKKVYSGSQYEKAMREDGRKVYELAKGKSSGSQQLLFDFGLQVGERQYFTLYENDVRYLEVTAIDHINSEGIEYRLMKLKQVIEFDGFTADFADCYWIEGIGGDCGIENTCNWSDSAGYTCLLLSCYDNEGCIFTIDALATVGLTMPKSDQQTDASVYDLQGRRVANTSRPGVIIREGRKVVRTRNHRVEFVKNK